MSWKSEFAVLKQDLDRVIELSVRSYRVTTAIHLAYDEADRMALEAEERSAKLKQHLIDSNIVDAEELFKAMVQLPDQQMISRATLQVGYFTVTLPAMVSEHSELEMYDPLHEGEIILELLRMAELYKVAADNYTTATQAQWVKDEQEIQDLLKGIKPEVVELLVNPAVERQKQFKIMFEPVIELPIAPFHSPTSNGKTSQGLRSVKRIVH